MTDTFTLERPADITDGRWSAIQALTTKLVTGHMPWCEEHRGTEDGDRGWCSADVSTFAASVEIHNCSNEGQIRLDLKIHDGLDLAELDVSQALGIAATITMAADRVRDLTPPSEV